ncbi:putative DNA binding domain-containing protein [bacterium]|nr:putative DNA binding domain-containing protein [bacterium]MBU1614782.1 putative DNA binding domain-containing protein [bacterium]
MFTQKEIKKIITKGETSGVEFKSEREKNVDLVKEITAFANGMGGYLIVGVEDNGEISGITNPSEFEEMIYNI